jgi:8-oxo-dGTP pyrophosphatase MutT (NUDIX family)
VVTGQNVGMDAVTPVPAAAVLLLRDEPPGSTGSRVEVFMVKRHDRVAFMAGAYVFPGGRIEAPDAWTEPARWSDGLSPLAERLTDLDSAGAGAHAVAAVRELFEEAGVLLARRAAGAFVSLTEPVEQARFDDHRRALHRGERSLLAIVEQEDLRVAFDILVPFANWVTPAAEPIRFDARFFAVRLPPGQHPLHDAAEATDGCWMSPADALQRCARNELFLPPPTWRTLRDVAQFASVEEVLGWARSRPLLRLEPTLVEEGGRRALILPPDPGSPVGFRTAIRFVFDDGRWRPAADRG